MASNEARDESLVPRAVGLALALASLGAGIGHVYAYKHQFLDPSYLRFSCGVGLWSVTSTLLIALIVATIAWLARMRARVVLWCTAVTAFVVAALVHAAFTIMAWSG